MYTVVLFIVKQSWKKSATSQKTCRYETILLSVQFFVLQTKLSVETEVDK